MSAKIVHQTGPGSISEKEMKNMILRENKRSSSIAGCFVAVAITVLFVYFLPIIYKPIHTEIIARFSVAQAYLILTLGTHTLFYSLGHGVLYFIYRAKHPFFEKYKVSDAPWPWESDPAKWKIQLRKTIKLFLAYHLLLVPAFLMIDVVAGIKIRHDIESYPTYSEMIPQVIFCMFCEDFLFYWVHRILHHPKLYPIIHKQHHEYSVPVSIAAEYSHPIEFIFQSLLAVTLGPKILGSRMHEATNVMFVIIRIFESIHAHSGYEFPWTPYGLIPWSSPASFHFFHHYQNIGNYGTFFEFWDHLCGTNKVYLRFLDKAKSGNIDSDGDTLQKTKRE